MTQDELKQAVARAALAYVVEGKNRRGGHRINCTDVHRRAGRNERPDRRRRGQLGRHQNRLEAHGIKVFDLNDVTDLPVYIDGADEINAEMHMIKGGGAALTREKIVSAVATKFICIADGSKFVPVLGKFPLPVEVIPMAWTYVQRELTKLGGTVTLREGVITDNGNLILDVKGLQIVDPVDLESRINQIVGVVTNGLFASRPADVCLLGTSSGVQTMSAD